MGLFTRDIKTMDDLLLHGLKDIYYAESQITPKLTSSASIPSARSKPDVARRERRA